MSSLQINPKLNKKTVSISGKWTPEIKGTTNAGTTNNMLRQGDYVVVGNLLVLSFKIGFNSLSGGSGYLKITGWEHLANVDLAYFAAEKVMAEGSDLFPNNTSVPYMCWFNEGKILISRGSISAINYQNVSTSHYVYGNIFLKIK